MREQPDPILAQVPPSPEPAARIDRGDAPPSPRRAAGPARRAPAPMPREPEPIGARLQRIAGNAALSRDVEAAEATRREAHEAAARAASAEAEAKKAQGRETPPQTPEMDAAREATAVAETLARKGEDARAAAARGAALAQVVGSFESDPGAADLAGLAARVDRAPRAAAVETARAVARAVMRAQTRKRAAIDRRIATDLPARSGLVLARLLRDLLPGVMPGAEGPPDDDPPDEDPTDGPAPTDDPGGP